MSKLLHGELKLSWLVFNKYFIFCKIWNAPTTRFYSLSGQKGQRLKIHYHPQGKVRGKKEKMKEKRKEKMKEKTEIYHLSPSLWRSQTFSNSIFSFSL